MFGFSTADGFVVINENLEEMIKYVANEPSVGMYFIQQHAQNAVPNLINLKTHVLEKSREATLHTEDLEESVAITRSMKECGFPIIDEMIRDITTTLTIVKEGIIQQQGLSYELSGPRFWVPVTWARGVVGDQNNEEGGRSYLYSMFRPSKDKAEDLKFASENGSFGQPDEGDKLRLCSQTEDVTAGDSNTFTTTSEYDEFKVDKQARLEEWLKGSGGAFEGGTGHTEGQS